MDTMTTTKRLATLSLALATAGCAGTSLGDIGEILTGGGAGGGGGGGSGTMTVEIQEVRSQQQQILVRTEDGQQGPVLFDQNTQVVYQGDQYPVEALERGDIVDMRIQEVQQGYYTDLIQVRQSVQDRQGGGTTGTPAQDVHRIEGTIGDIDLQRWMFTLEMTQGGTLPVYLPSSAPASARDRLRQHQSGDYVRVEVRPIDEQTAELVNWDWPG